MFEKQLHPAPLIVNSDFIIYPHKPEETIRYLGVDFKYSIVLDQQQIIHQQNANVTNISQHFFTSIDKIVRSATKEILQLPADTQDQGHPNYGPRALSGPPTPFLWPASAE